MAEKSTLARPYAKAAFEYAREHDALAQWQQQLATVAAVAEQPAVRGMLASPSLTSAQQAQLFVELCGDELDDKGRNLVMVLAEHRRLPLLSDIYRLFHVFKAAHERSVDVDIVTAMELDENTREKLAEALRKKLDREIRIKASVDEKLLAGAVVRAGDLVIDASLRGRLAKLAEAINS